MELLAAFGTKTDALRFRHFLEALVRMAPASYPENQAGHGLEDFDAVQGVSFDHRLLRYPLLYQPHAKRRPKESLIKAYLDLVLGWGQYRSGYLRIS